MTSGTPAAIETPPSRPQFVVGVGASAGGLEALQHLFEKTELTGAFAYAVIQHLSPDFESVMGELLAPHTPLKVVRAQHGMKLQADHVYLMPPRHEMAVRDGQIQLTERDPAKGLFLPIDVFFRSLAEDFGPRAVGIVLSGTGSDGSRGVRAIHEAGGLIIAQDDTAKFDGMPRSAVDTGTVDLVLPPEAMADALGRYQAHNGQLDDVNDANPDVLVRIFELLRRESGIDFAGYKGSTVGRRIQRRLLLTRSGDLGQYLDRIAADQNELRSLYCDLLIGVTRFFRDEEVFDRLRNEVVPGLVDALANDDELRVWVAGCASGEEAYSMAIVLAEEFRRRNRLGAFRVFATDVHSASLEAASAGVYSADSVERVPVALRESYFRPHRDGFQIAPELRGHVVFAHHNLLRDAPFTRLDLVSCRNVLIYLGTNMQRKALAAFHFALKTNGVLVLGPSESPASVGDAFSIVDSRWKMFRKLHDARILADIRNTPATFEGTGRGVSRRPPEDVRVSRSRELLLQEYGPPSLLVDGELRLLHTFNAASEFLTPKDGRPSLNLLDLVDGELRAVLSAAIRRAQRDMRTVRLDGVNVATARGERQVSVVVRPVQGNGRAEDAWSISLEPKPADGQSAALPPDGHDRGEMMTERVSSLEGELRFARENLQATIEEMETSNEELQATNEELIASNEELQSTNEELHSVNEELYTVNAEYQSKIAELTELTADMTHLLEATEVHTLFVDKDLRLRKFTPKIGEAFHLLPQDVGRRLDSFAHDFQDDELLADLERVLASGTTIEREVRDRTGRPYFMRILPYRSTGGIAGVVLTLIDLAALKTVQRDLEGVLEHSPSFIYLKDASGRYLVCGRQCEQIMGQRRELIIGKTDQQLLPPAIAEARGACEQRVIATGETVELEEQLLVGADVRSFLTIIFPLRDGQGMPYAVAGISTDITEQKRASDEARRDVQRRDQFLAMLSHELRTPLGAILNATELIERKGAPANGGAAHTVIRRQARHMGRLIDDLLDVGRVTRQQLVLQTQIVDMREVIRDALDTVRRDAERKELQLACTIADQALTVRGDPVRLRQVVTNLAANAVTYTQAGTVAVEAGRSNGTVSVTVRDTGVGLAPDEVTKVFDLFYQVPQPLDRPRGGLGVGLTLAQKLVSLHDGTIDVRSDGPGKGSLFTVSLPFVSATPAQSPPDDQPPKLRIVIVEDNDDNREMLAELLRSEGHDVWAADNGVAGTELILHQRPDVALVDVGLPGIDGFSVASRVREETAGLVRLVALTGYGLPHDRARATECGFDRHILKPVEPSVLFRVLREMSAPQAA
jgi:two-component system CheB/CheR fusion protein